MARYLLDTESLGELVRRDPTLATVRWANTIDRLGNTLLVSVVSIGQIEQSIADLGAGHPAQAPLRGNFEDALQTFAATGGIVSLDLRCARRWATLESLELPCFAADDAAGRVPMSTLARQVVAQALADELGLTLVARVQPCFGTLTSLGLSVVDPSTGSRYV